MAQHTFYRKHRLQATPDWIHPWDIEKFDDMSHDNRFFSLLIKGALSWLDSNIRLYNKGIRHFILNTGKEYLYQEANGYDFSWNETTGEDYIYMQKPRCVVVWENVEVLTQEISSPYSYGTYERYANVSDELLGDRTEIHAYTAEVRIIPVKLPIQLKYVLSNFNEAVILTEELLSLFSFTRYFSVTYLGRKIDCSLEFPTQITPGKSIKVGYNADDKSREIEITVDLKTTFPTMFEASEVDTSKVISNWQYSAYPVDKVHTDDYTRDRVTDDHLWASTHDDDVARRVDTDTDQMYINDKNNSL